VLLGANIIAIREPNSATPGLFSFEFTLEEPQLGSENIEIWVLVRNAEAAGIHEHGADDKERYLAKHESLLYIFGDSIQGVRRIPGDGIGPLLLDDLKTGDVELVAEGGNVWGHSKVLESSWDWFRDLKIGEQSADTNGAVPSQPVTPDSAPSGASYGVTALDRSKRITRVTIPISIDTLRIIVNYVYLGTLPSFGPDEKGVEGACGLYAALGKSLWFFGRFFS
jgi:hypothetical protein